MHYFFVDESYREEPARRTIKVACWSVEQGRLNRGQKTLNGAFRPPLVKSICSVLKHLDALALLASTTLERSIYRTGEVDATDDISGMARSDNIWSLCVSFAIATLILEHLQRGRPVDTVDIYFDPKSLRAQHEEAWRKALRGLVVREATRFAAQLGKIHLEKLKVRRIESVAKPRNGNQYDKFQIGTWVADKICEYAGQMREADGGCIKVYDSSDTIKRTIQQWDGRSFYD